MNLPTEQQCLELFRTYNVPRHIFEHCLNVSKLTLFLAQKLKERGQNLNLELVHRIALLHDLFKVVAIEELSSLFSYSEEEIKMWKTLRQKYPDLHECDVAYLVFKEEFPELALAIKHASDPLKKDKSIEEDLAHYADWRVSNNQIVSLSDRLIYLKQRYPKGDQYWQQRSDVIFQIEKRLFSHLDFSPEQISQLIKDGR